MAKINGSSRAMATVKQNAKKLVKTIRSAITLLYQWTGSVTCPSFVVLNQGSQLEEGWCGGEISLRARANLWSAKRRKIYR